MPQTKINCKTCRRLIGKDVPACPFCGTPNLYYEQEQEKKMPAQKGKKKESLSEQKKTSSFDMSAQNSKEISVEDIEALYNEPLPIGSQTKTSGIPAPPEDTSESSSCNPEENAIISSVPDSHRAHIAWSDEAESKTSESDYTEMFNEKGVYQANYDGYYNDTLPKIQDEIDHIMAGREKTFLKAVFTIIGIVAVIVYLVLTN